MTTALFFALCSNFVFSFASTRFTRYTARTNALWMNCMKALVALAASIIAVLVTQKFDNFSATNVSLLLTSGFIGLFVGDLFMLESMKLLGTARMLMMFGLTPFLTGVGSFLIFDTRLKWQVWIGVLFMLACLFMLAFEKYKASGHWHIRGVTFGFLAVTLDATGLLITKYCFTQTAELHPFQVNLIRVVGACIGFGLVHAFYQRIPIWSTLKSWGRRDQVEVLTSSFLGTFLSLFFFLTAISMGPLAVISSLAGTGPLFAEMIDSYQNKKWPHPYWWVAFTFFLGGIGFFNL